jgi:hypothetical protein
MTQESRRLEEARGGKAWKKWGPYLSERQWGTVREDYSKDGNAWNYFTHDQARSRAYRWGEDGLAGISDDRQNLCFSLALWNGNDPILKERLFGLTNTEGNHGEDVKEYYFYLDNTPTHSYMKYLYKYPQQAFPYDDLVATNKKRSRYDFEYELLNTGIFDSDRYFDVFVEYAKESPEDILIKISIWNRGPERAPLHVLPTLWFRNTWSEGAVRPKLLKINGENGMSAVAASHPELGERFLYCEGSVPLLFTENETNNERIFGTTNRTPYVKDSINNFLVHQQSAGLNPNGIGTKVSPHYRVEVNPGQCQIIRLRLNMVAPRDLNAKFPEGNRNPFGEHFDVIMKTRLEEADQFYSTVIPPSLDPDAAKVMRQAMAGMLWSKQFYNFDVNKWLKEHGADPFQPGETAQRNAHWHHICCADIISMPDKWEYPWYAAWDLAFHILALSLVDEEFGKQQLDLMLRGRYIHPNGQLPRTNGTSETLTRRCMPGPPSSHIAWKRPVANRVILSGLSARSRNFCSISLGG